MTSPYSVTLLLECTVDGQPVPQGSMTPFIHHASGKVVTPQKQSVKTWRDTIATIARANYRGDLTPDPVRVHLAFALNRPKSHYGTGRNAGQLKPSATRWATGPPDLDKLTRAVLDALTGIVWDDDSQVETLTARKWWDTTPATTIWVWQGGKAEQERIS